MANTSLKRL